MPRPITPGGYPDSGADPQDVRKFAAEVARSVRVGTGRGGAVSVVGSPDGFDVLDGAPRRIFGRLTGYSSSLAAYSFTQVVRTAAGTGWTDAVADRIEGATNRLPARERNGKGNAPTDGSLVVALDPDPDEDGWLFDYAGGCAVCPEALCAYYDAAGNVVGYGYTSAGIPRAIVACPALPPPPPPVAGGTCPAIPVICVTVTGATADVTMTDGFLENFDTTGNPTAESRGTYYQNTANKCVYGRDPTQDLGASYTESDYAALMEAVGLDNPSPYGASDYGEYLPFGHDPGITTGTYDQIIPFVGQRVTPTYVPASRQWSISVPKVSGGGAINPSFLSTPHAEGASPLPAVFPAQSITDQVDANNAIVYAITGARIEAGVCLGVLAPSMGSGLFPGTTPPATFNLATTNPADTATLPMSPVAGGWAGATAGGVLPVLFSAAGGGPTISIDGVPIPLAVGGSTPDVYTFTDGTLTAVVYR